MKIYNLDTELVLDKSLVLTFCGSTVVHANYGSKVLEYNDLMLLYSDEIQNIVKQAVSREKWKYCEVKMQGHIEVSPTQKTAWFIVSTWPKKYDSSQRRRIMIQAPLSKHKEWEDVFEASSEFYSHPSPSPFLVYIPIRFELDEYKKISQYIASK